MDSGDILNNRTFLTTFPQAKSSNLIRPILSIITVK